MKKYNITLDLNYRKVLVVGGGKIAERKIKGLLKAEASITVISPALTANLDLLQQKNKFTWLQRKYQAQDAFDYFLVFATTNDPAANQLVNEDVKLFGGLVNICDDPLQNDFNVPSVIPCGEEITFSVSTNGLSPALTKLIAQDLGERYGENFASFAKFLAQLRQKIKKQLLDSAEREKLWQTILTKEIFELVRQEKLDEAEERINNAISSFGLKS